MAGKVKSKAGSILQRASLRFLAVFALTFGVPYIVMQRVDLSIMTGWIAAFESWVLRSFSIPAFSVDSLIFIANSSAVYQIVAECTGLVMVILLFALLYSTPLDSRRRLRSLALYIPLLLAFNLLRLAVTFLAGSLVGPSALEPTHVALWFVDSGVVLAVWSESAQIRLL